MLLEAQEKKMARCANVTEEDIKAEVAISIEDRVTPYHNVPYDEQIARKEGWLRKQLSGFCSTYSKFISQNREYPTAWFKER